MDFRLRRQKASPYFGTAAFFSLHSKTHAAQSEQLIYRQFLIKKQGEKK
jgi:hypothetical protein